MAIKSLQKWVLCTIAAVLLLGGLNLGLSIYASEVGDANHVASIPGATTESETNPEALAEGQPNDVALNTTTLMDESQIELEELETWTNLLRERSGLTPIEINLQATAESRITSLEIYIGELETTNGLTPVQLNVEQPVESRIDDVRNRLLLVSVQADKMAADRLQRVQEEQQFRISDLEQNLAKYGQATIFGSITALLALILALTLGGYTLYMAMRQKESQSKDTNAKDQKFEVLAKEQIALRKEIEQLRTENLSLRQAAEECKAELQATQSNAFSSISDMQTVDPIQMPFSSSPAEKNVLDLPIQSNCEIGKLQTKFDPTLSDSIYLTAGENYILYEDNTVAYALKRPYGELSSFMRNGLLRMYDIKVGDKVYTYQECKESGCPSFYLEVKANLRRAEVKLNSAGVYDLKRAGLLEAILIS